MSRRLKENYRRLKEHIRIKNSERGDSKRDRLIIKQNERINNNLKPQAEIYYNNIILPAVQGSKSLKMRLAME